MTCTASFVATALPSPLMTWRCSGCLRIVARLEYDGRTVIEIKHHCNKWNRLPDDRAYLSAEADRCTR